MQGDLGKDGKSSTVVLNCISTGDTNGFQSGTPVAFKAIQKSSATCIDDILAVEREIKALALLSPHPNVVRYHATLHGKERIYLLMESYPMDLFEFIGSFKTKIDKEVSSFIVHEVLTGVAHLDSKGVCHRDLKPENILVFLTCTDFSIKLCDFGLCEVFSGEDRQLHNFRGSPGFFAPECLVQDNYCGFKADVFSVGCIALELLLTHTFFNDHWMTCYQDLQREGKTEFVARIGTGLKAVRAEMERRFVEPESPLRLNRRRLTNLAPSRKISPVKTFVEQSLEPQPSRRPTATELLANAWVKEGKKLQLLDTLHNRSDRVYIDMPNVSPSKSDCLRARGGGEDNFTMTSPRSSPDANTAADADEDTNLSVLSPVAPEPPTMFERKKSNAQSNGILPVLDASPPSVETDDVHLVHDEGGFVVTPIEFPSPQASPFISPFASASTSRAPSPVTTLRESIDQQEEELHRSSSSSTEGDFSPDDGEGTDSEGVEERKEKVHGPISSIMQKYKSIAKSDLAPESAPSGSVHEGGDGDDVGDSPSPADNISEPDLEHDDDDEDSLEHEPGDLDELAVKVYDIECLMRKMSQSAAQTDKAIQGIFGAIEVGLCSTVVRTSSTPALPSYAQPKSQKIRQASKPAPIPTLQSSKKQPLLHLERMPEKCSRMQLPMAKQNVKVPQARSYNLAKTASSTENLQSPYLITKPHFTAASYNPLRGKLSI